MSNDSDRNTEPAPNRSVISKPLLAMAAAALAIPALIPLLVLIEPRLVPFISPVEPGDLTTTLFMVGLSLFLLAVNWGFLYAVYRWINKFGGPQ